MEKARDAFRTISEVAKWLETPAHVLRFWESKFAQVKPVKRAGGRRYYRPSDMTLLGGIKKLLHEDGMTIKGVQKILREEGVKHVAALSPPLDLEAEGDQVDGLLDETVTKTMPESPAPTPTTMVEPPIAAPEAPATFPTQPANQNAEAVVAPAGDDDTSDDHPDDQDAEAAKTDSDTAAPAPDAAPDTSDDISDDDFVDEAEEDAQDDSAPTVPVEAESVPEPEQEPEAPEPETPLPLIAEGADDDPADAELDVPPTIAAQIRAMDKAALAHQRDNIAPLFARLTELRDRMGR